jgi:hypothetical protein
VSERWIPVLAAVVGVLGGIGGAYIGGAMTNEGQEQRLASEQTERTQELHRETYAEFLLAAAKVNQGAGGDVAEEDRRQEEVDAAEARVELFANDDVREAAGALLDAVKSNAQGEDYAIPRIRFLDAAKEELQADE